MIGKATAGVVIAMLTLGSAFAQTSITLPKNNFTPQQDVELGLKGAAEVRTQFPVIDNAAIATYFSTLGDRLVAVAPQELKHSAFQYSFTPSWRVRVTIRASSDGCSKRSSVSRRAEAHSHSG